MTEVHQAAAGGKRAVALDFSDGAAVRAWLHELRMQIDEAVAAGEDATRPPKHRTLGRKEARRALMEAQSAIAQVLAAGDQGASAPGRRRARTG